MNIDLHIHSNFSDGTYSTEELLTKFNELSLDIVSVTDHESIQFYKDLEKYKHLIPKKRMYFRLCKW